MIKEWMAKAIKPCLLLSGGADSVELLERIGKIDCVTFNQNFTTEQWKVIDNLIRKFDLDLFTFPPSASYVVPNGDELARIDEYQLGYLTFPVLREYAHSDRCSLEFDNKKMPMIPWTYDAVFVGSRKTDWSPLTGQPLRQAVTEYGGITIVAPLYDEPKTQEFDVDTGTVYGCTKCFNGEKRVYCLKEDKMIDGIDWDRESAIKAFQDKFQLGEHNGIITD